MLNKLSHDSSFTFHDSSLPLQPLPLQSLPLQPLPLQSLPLQPLPLQPLPLRAAEADTDVAALECRVLLVEDNPITQLVTLQQLRQLGCTSRAASSGVEALEAQKNEHFDLILLDCRLPDMDGYETARAIRKYERGHDGKHVAIVAVTADGDLECVDKCLSAGMDAHVQKPTSVAVLREVLARHMR